MGVCMYDIQYLLYVIKCGSPYIHTWLKNAINVSIATPKYGELFDLDMLKRGYEIHIVNDSAKF